VTTLAEVRAALGSALESVEGLAVHETLGGPFNVPCALIELAEIPVRRDTFSRTGTISLPMLVTVLVGRSVDQIAQSHLDEYTDWAGDLSISAALELDQTLGGAAETVQVVSDRPVGRVELDGAPVFGREFSVTVTAQRERPA
jgi:hypothetical protein